MDSIFTYRVDHGSSSNFMAKGHARYFGPVRGPHVKKTVGGLLNCLIYCDVFMVYTEFTKVASGRVIQPGGPLFRLPWF